MTLEELAIKIKNGEHQYIDELWVGLEKFINWKATKFYSALGDRLRILGYTHEDLTQTGYFALLDAIQAYTEDTEYKFITFFSYHLKNHFIKMAGYRTTGDKKRTELEMSEISIFDAVISNSNGDDKTYEDYLPDERAEQALNDVIGDNEQINIHEDLEHAISELDERKANIIKNRYYKNNSIADLAKSHKVSNIRIRQLEKEALDYMRKSKYLKKYERFKSAKETLISKYEKGFSVGKFKNTWSSSQEAYMIQLEKLEKEYGLK